MKAIKTLMGFILTLVLILGCGMGVFTVTSYAEEISDGSEIEVSGEEEDATVVTELFTPAADETVVTKEISIATEDDWQTVPETINTAIKGALITVGVNEDIIDDIISGEMDVHMITPVKIKIAMTGTDKVPKEIFETIKEKNVEVEFSSKTGAVWTINGQNITDADLTDMDESLDLNAAGPIPLEKLADGDVVEIDEETIDEGNVVIDEEVDQQAPMLQNTPDSSWIWYIFIAAVLVAFIASATLVADRKRKHEEM